MPRHMPLSLGRKRRNRKFRHDWTISAQNWRGIERIDRFHRQKCMQRCSPVTENSRWEAGFAGRQHLLNFENQCQCSAGAIAGPKREKEAPRWDRRKRDRKKAVKAAYWSVSSRRLECQPRFTVCAKREPVHAF